MSDIRTVEIAGAIISVLLSTGAVAFFIKYETRIALVERMLETSQLITLHPRLSLVETAVQEIKNSLNDLKHLPRISAQLEGLQDVMKNIVPRAEHESRWNSNDDKLTAMASDINYLKHKK